MSGVDLIKAVIENNFERVQLLVRDGMDVNFRKEQSEKDLGCVSGSWFVIC